MFWCEFDAEHGAILHARALGSYLEGLEEMGWRGDSELVRLTYMTAAVARAAGNLTSTGRWAVEPDWKRTIAGLMNKTPEALADHWHDVFMGAYRLFQKELNSAGL